MKQVLTTRVGADGVLTLMVPLGKTDANHLVRVVVETLEEGIRQASPVADRDEWLRFIQQTAGSIDDPTFERPPQGEYEERDSLS
jgi:methionine aminopeptidase